MIVLAGIAIGVIIGLMKARSRGGNGFDKAQYATVWAILLGLLGLFVTIVVERML